MKRIFSYVAVAALAFGMASCAKDNTINEGPDGNGLSAFQFTLKTSQGSFVTRAIADGEEWTVNDVNIYAFDAGTKALIGTNSDFTYSSPTGAAVLTASEAWLSANQNKSINVYFVGNKGANSTNSTSHVSLNGFAGNEDAIKELLTDVQADLGGGKAKKLTTPLLFSAYTLSPVTVPSVGKVTVPISLTRREARFDIVNPIPANFVISKVVIKNANTQGYIFGANSDNLTMAAGNIEEITTIPSFLEANAWLGAKVFYLYPTKLGVGQDTEISIIASVNGGAETAFPVKSAAAIEANKRYKLSLNPATLEFDVTVDDYEEGDEYPIVTIDQLTMSGFAFTGDASFDAANGIINVAGNSNASTVTLNVFASTAAGVDINYDAVVGAHAVTTNTNSTDPTVTYSNIGYKTTIKIDIAGHDGSAPFQTNVTIADKGNPAATAELKVVYGSLNLGGDDAAKGGMSDDLVEWIKENVTGGSDVVTPGDLKSVTELDLSNSDATSLDGIENFPNLEELNAEGNTNLTGKVDLSGNPELTNVNLKGTGVTEVDLSQNTALETLDISNANLTGNVDLTNNTNLESCRLNNNPNLISVDLGNNENLKLFAITTISGFNNVESVNFSGCPNLEILGLGGSKISSVDLSNNTKIKTLLFSNMLNLTALNVSMLLDLEALLLDNVNIQSIDLTQNTKLKQFNADGAALTSFDISNCPNLAILVLRNMPNPLTVTVWKGFNIGNLSSYSTSGSDVTFTEVTE